MATKIITHDEHDHIYKTTKETIEGIEIDDSKSDKIGDAFGWSDEKFDSLAKTLERFNKFQLAAQELNPDLPESTKISTLADFLKSDSFRKLGIKLKTPNDYLMLGYVFHMTIGASPVLGLPSLFGGGGVADLLEHIKKHRK